MAKEKIKCALVSEVWFEFDWDDEKELPRSRIPEDFPKEVQELIKLNKTELGEKNFYVSGIYHLKSGAAVGSCDEKRYPAKREESNEGGGSGAVKVDYSYRGPTLKGIEFTSRYKYGDIVKFTPDGKTLFDAVVVGCVFKGHKNGYSIVLETGADTKVYGERVLVFPVNEDLKIKTIEFFNNVLGSDEPGL